MKRLVLVKAFTLMGFLFLVSVFLFYRSGYFNSYFGWEDQTAQTSPNGGKITTTVPDTLPHPRNQTTNSNLDKRSRNSEYYMRMAGSKSIVAVSNDPYINEQKKREYLRLALRNRFEYFQDSLKSVSKPLDVSFFFWFDTSKMEKPKINWLKQQ